MAMTPDLESAALTMFRSKAGLKNEDPSIPRLVIDTNVLLDLLFWHDPHMSALEAGLAAGRWIALRDESTLLECVDVLTRLNFWGESEEAHARILSVVGAWCDRTEVVPESLVQSVGSTVPVKCKDPLDQKFLELVYAAKAPYLLTKDKLVLRAGKRLKKDGLLVMTPEAFLAQAAA